MDPIEFAAGISIVVASLGGTGFLFILARGLVRRWSEPSEGGGADEIRELRHQVSQIAAEVAELHERIDFTERVLAAHQDVPRLEERH